LLDCLIDWLIDWVIDWLIDWHFLLRANSHGYA
jgi:hypothetical protein